MRKTFEIVPQVKDGIAKVDAKLDIIVCGAEKIRPKQRSHKIVLPTTDDKIPFYFTTDHFRQLFDYKFEPKSHEYCISKLELELLSPATKNVDLDKELNSLVINNYEPFTS